MKATKTKNKNNKKTRYKALINQTWWFKTKEDNKQKNNNKITSWTKKQTKQKEKERTRKRDEKTGRKEGRKKITREGERERDKERERKKGGGSKTAKEKQRETQINKKWPSYTGKNRVFSIKHQERKAKTKKTNQKLKIKGGLRAKWGGPLGHLTWPLHPPKNKNKTNKTNKQKRQKHKNTQKKQKQNKEGLGPSEVALRATSPDP